MTAKHIEQIIREKERRLDEKIDLTERYLAERCVRIEAQISAADKLLSLANESSKVAVEKADAAIAHRFDSYNEFNQRMTAMSATFFTTSAHDAFRLGIDSWRTEVNSRLDKKEGQGQGVRLTGSVIFGGIMLTATVVGVVVAFISRMH